MKAPYDITESDYSDLVKCPHCGELTDHLMDNIYWDHWDNALQKIIQYKSTGCESCVAECDYCGEKIFKDDLHDCYLRKSNRWVKSKVCDYCWYLYNDFPDEYDDISEIDPTNVKLFDKLFNIFK